MLLKKQEKRYERTVSYIDSRYVRFSLDTADFPREPMANLNFYFSSIFPWYVFKHDN